MHSTHTTHQTSPITVSCFHASCRSLGTQLSAAGEKERTLRDQYKQKEAEYASMLEEVKR